MLSYFDKVFVINLQEREDRWKECIQIFEEYGIQNYERFDAIKDPASPTLGAGKSLANILTLVKQNNYSNVFIFEDDFNFQFPPEETKSILEKSILELPDDWDFFYLGANLEPHIIQPNISKFSENLYKIHGCYCIHALGISKSAIEKMENNLNCLVEEDFAEKIIGKYGVADVYIGCHLLQQTNSFIPSELVCNQRPSFSDLQHTFTDYTDWILTNFNNAKQQLEKSEI